MLGPNQSPLNRLERELPEGLLVDSAWLKERGYSRQLLNHYVHTGWLNQPARGVYRRSRGSLKWEQVVIALQTLLDGNLLVGGRTALELQGFAHYLQHETKEVHLYGPKPPPTWLRRLTTNVKFVYHNSHRLFVDETVADFPKNHAPDDSRNAGSDDTWTNFVVQHWGQWDWPLEHCPATMAHILPRRNSWRRFAG